MKHLEWFSGIGGMRLALPCPFDDIISVDVSPVPNAVYKHNFDRNVNLKSAESGRLIQKLVEHLDVKFVDGLAASLWTLSPPCQPFTTTGHAKQLHEKDNRCDGLKHVISLLEKSQNLPTWILLENVKGFYQSEIHQTLLKVCNSLKCATTYACS